MSLTHSTFACLFDIGILAPAVLYVNENIRAFNKKLILVHFFFME